MKKTRCSPVKLTALGLALVLLLSANPVCAAPQTPVDRSGSAELSLEDLVYRQLQAVDSTELERITRGMSPDTTRVLPEFSLRSVVDYMTGRKALPELGSLLTGAAGAALDEVRQNAALLGKLVTLAVLAALLQNIHAAFQSETIGKVSYTVVYLALAALAITSFHQAMELARGIVDSLVEFMVALLPLLTTLLAGVGAVTSAGVLHPLILLVANLVSIVAADIVLPLLFLAAVVKIVDRFHEGVRVSRVADLLQQGAVTVLGLTMSLFLGVITVQGAASAVVDGVGVRSAKFASKAFVPVLGSMFSDTVELMAGSSLLLKNAASIYGLVAVVVLTLYPALKLIGLIFSYRVAAALIQPIDDGPVVGLLGSMAGSLTVLTVCAGTVMVMFFLVLTITAGLGNATVMLR